VAERTVEHLMEQSAPAGVSLKKKRAIFGERYIPTEKGKSRKGSRMRRADKVDALAPEG
jgi:hypothetical protein